MNSADPLLALRDIHVPPPPGFWPPAPGWIGSACIVIAMAAVAVIVARRWWRAGQPRREALAALRALRKLHRDGATDTEIAVELSVLVRRVALARAPREEVAGLTGERWIEWIESTLPRSGEDFGTGLRAALHAAPYARRCRFDAAHALSDCETWIRRA